MSADDYKHLSADRILATIERLRERIAERFPDAGLCRVCGELADTARTLGARAHALAQPLWVWRIAAVALIVAGVAAQIAALRYVHPSGAPDAAELVQSLEAAVNLLILFGGAAWFLLTLEERAKRRRALDALHQLRALTHVIDMHQLTKDPTLVMDTQRTPASPERRMTRFELTRYLDYCS